ncbi:MAG: hypothetical protein AABY22_17905 [Nanoarchaeota archaeon]
MGLFSKKPTVELPEKQPQKRGSDDCVIEIKNTAQGRKLKISKNCNKEQIRAFANDNHIDLE